MQAHGVVKLWSAEKGVGAVSSPALPPGKDAWMHVATLEAGVTTTLLVRQRLRFAFRRQQRESFEYVVESAWFDEGAVTRRRAASRR